MNLSSKLEIYTKRPEEVLPIDVGFGKLHILPRGATKIVSATASAKRWKRKFPQNVEGANDFLTSTTPTILTPGETTVRITATGGIDGYDYAISLKVTFDNNAVLENEIYVRVKEPISDINFISDTVSGGFDLTRLDDVTINNPQNNQIIRYNSTTSQWQNTSVGIGDVTGPATSTDNSLARFDGTTGKIIQNSTASLSDTGALDVSSITSDYIQIDTAATQPTVSQGTLAWDSGNGTLKLGLAGSNVEANLAEQQFIRVYNDTASTMSKGQVVYISGSQGNRIAVKLAQANSELKSKDTVGFVAEEILSNSEGWVISSGSFHKLNTATLVAGDTIYLSPSVAGGYTTTKPIAPNHTVILGFVQRVHASVGSFFVKVDNGYEIDELHNVKIVSPVTGNLMIYNSTSGNWENKNFPVSATDKLLGRSSVGAGDVEEITCTAAGRALLADNSASAQLTTLNAQKKISIGTELPTGGDNGDIYLQYTEE